MAHRRDYDSRDIYQHRPAARSPQRHPKEYVIESHDYHRHHKPLYRESSHAKHNHNHTNGDKLPERNLYEWGKWRTEINKNIIHDVMKPNGKTFSSMDRVVKNKDGYKHDRTGAKVIGDPRYVMSYSLSTNQITELSPGEFLAYGIPRAKVNLNHHSDRKHRVPSEYRKEDLEKLHRKDRNYDERNFHHSSSGRQRDTYHDRRHGDNRHTSAHAEHRRVQRSASPKPRDYEQLRPKESRHSNYRGRSPSPPHYRNGHRYRQDASPDRRDHRYDEQHRSEEFGNEIEEDRNSLILEDAGMFAPKKTPRRDYNLEEDNISDAVDEGNQGNQIPESLQKVFANHQGEHKPFRVYPSGPPPPPPPPPPPLPT